MKLKYLARCGITEKAIKKNTRSNDNEYTCYMILQKKNVEWEKMTT